jgi:hypothetical protein
VRRIQPFPSLFLMVVGALPAQDGLGLAYYQHCFGSKNAVALAPDLAVERVMIDVQQALATWSSRRQRALEKQAVRDPRSFQLWQLILATPADQRGEVMRLIDPVAYRPIWPRSFENGVAEIRCFEHRHLGVAEPAELSPVRAFGAAIWGSDSEPVGGGAPCDGAAARAAFLARLSRGEAAGVVPRLLQAIGEGSAELGDPAARRAVWLDVAERWSAGSLGSERNARGWHVLKGRSVHVVGSADEWRCAAEASLRLQAAIETAVGAKVPQPSRDHAGLEGLRRACEVCAEVAALPVRRPLTEPETDLVAALVQNRDVLAGLRGPSGAPSVVSVSRTLSIGDERLAAFVLERSP